MDGFRRAEEEQRGGGILPAQHEERKLAWQRAHVVHLWRNGLLGGVAVATGATMALLAWYVTGGILPAGWGGLVVVAGLAGGAVGWAIAWWEDKEGWSP